MPQFMNLCDVSRPIEAADTFSPDKQANLLVQLIPHPLDEGLRTFFLIHPVLDAQDISDLQEGLLLMKRESTLSSTTNRGQKKIKGTKGRK